MPDDDKIGVEAITNLDKLIHEPARLAILMLLYVVDRADFIYIKTQTNLTKGNLSAHLGKLEDAGYVEIEKTYEGKVPRTLCQLSEVGRAKFQVYLVEMKEVLNGLPD